jgi:hypothetical protein
MESMILWESRTHQQPRHHSARGAEREERGEEREERGEEREERGEERENETVSREEVGEIVHENLQEGFPAIGIVDLRL